MSISKIELIETLNKIAPIAASEAWDNCGMQVDLGAENISKILISLEITQEVLMEAQAQHVDFIVTHHPLLFSPMKKVDNNSFTGSAIIALINAGISVYSAHTSFDKAALGNNHQLARLLNLQNVDNFEKMGAGYIGLFGYLAEQKTLKDMVELLKEKLDLNHVEIRIIGDLERPIQKVGLCTGAGADMLEIAALNRCELFVTGDVKYHDAMKAKELNMNVIDAGHYGTEKIFSANMAAQLKVALGDRVTILTSQIDLNPFQGR